MEKGEKASRDCRPLTRAILSYTTSMVNNKDGAAVADEILPIIVTKQTRSQSHKIHRQYQHAGGRGGGGGSRHD